MTEGRVNLHLPSVAQDNHPPTDKSGLPQVSMVAPLLGAESYAGKVFLDSAALGGGRNGRGKVKTRGLPDRVAAGTTKGDGADEHVYRGIKLTLRGWGHTVSAHWLEPRAQATFPRLAKQERTPYPRTLREVCD